MRPELWSTESQRYQIKDRFSRQFLPPRMHATQEPFKWRTRAWLLHSMNAWWGKFSGEPVPNLASLPRGSHSWNNFSLLSSRHQPREETEANAAPNRACLDPWNSSRSLLFQAPTATIGETVRFPRVSAAVREENGFCLAGDLAMRWNKKY